MIKNNLVVILSSLTLSLRCCCFFFFFFFKNFKKKVVIILSSLTLGRRCCCCFFLKTLKNTGSFAELLCYAAASQYIQTPKTKPNVSKFKAELNEFIPSVQKQQESTAIC